MLWAKGLLAAMINGAASAVALVIVDPQTYNLQEGWQRLLTVMAVSAILGAASYLKQSPIPPPATGAP